MTRPAANSTANPPPAAGGAAAELVAQFRRQRPLRGGSLIVTLFGDAIMPRGGAVALGSLIALAAPFGLNERLVRTATAPPGKGRMDQGTARRKTQRISPVARWPRTFRRGDQAHLRRTGR